MSPSSATSSNSPPITGAASRLIRSTRPPWPLIPLKLDICVPPNSTCVEFYRLNFGAQELVARRESGLQRRYFTQGPICLASNDWPHLLALSSLIFGRGLKGRATSLIEWQKDRASDERATEKSEGDCMENWRWRLGRTPQRNESSSDNHHHHDKATIPTSCRVCWAPGWCDPPTPPFRREHAGHADRHTNHRGQHNTESHRRGENRSRPTEP